MVVAAVGAILAAGAMVSMTAFAQRTKETRLFEVFIAAIQDQRAAHVAAGRDELLAICVDCFNETGSLQPTVDRSTLDFVLLDPAVTLEVGTISLEQKFEGLRFRLSGSGPILLDALGRSIEVTDTGERVDKTQTLEFTFVRAALSR